MHKRYNLERRRLPVLVYRREELDLSYKIIYLRWQVHIKKDVVESRISELLVILRNTVL